MSLLEELVARDTLTIKEVVLFQAVDRWATKQCEKQGFAADGQTKRRVLVEEVIKAIRFPVMTAQEFADVVLDTCILHLEEVKSVFKYFNSALPSPLAFSNTLRQSSVLCDIHRCGRFQSVSGTGWAYTKQGKDRLAFSVNRDITLHGVSLFGSENNSYTVTLEVKDSTNNTTVVSKSGTYPSKRLAYKSDLSVSYYGFEVLFDSAASLKMSTFLRNIEALICGPSSGAGRNGIESVIQSGVTFTFAAVVRAESNGTQVSVGQFPEFLLSR